MDQSKATKPSDQILYRRPLPVIPDNVAAYSPVSLISEEEDEQDEFPERSPAPPASRERKRANLPPLLINRDTPFAEEEIWQWLITNTELTSSPSLPPGRSRQTMQNEIPETMPNGMPGFPSRQPRRNRARIMPNFDDPFSNNENQTKKQHNFALQDFIVKLEKNALVSKPVIERAILSKFHYGQLVKVLQERVEEDAKKLETNKAVAVFDINEEFDMMAFKERIKSPRPELESALSDALYEHVRQVDMEHQKQYQKKKYQLDQLELPPSLVKMKENQQRRQAWRKKQQKMNADLENNSLVVFGKGNSVEIVTKGFTGEYNNTTDSLQFYAEPTHFQDSVRTKEPFTLVNREDEVTPTEFAVLESLFSGGRWLSLKAHFISEIPNLILLRRTLTYINLSFNCFQEIPPEIYEMESLQILKLRNNPITEIPHDFIRLKRLRVLVLSFCMVSSISAAFWYGMERLILLDLSFNKLRSIPNEVMYLKNLRELNLAGNLLIGLPAGSLYLNLKTINISNNFMHPLLWRENAKNSPQRLQDMAAHVMVREELMKYYPDLPEQVTQYLQSGYTLCDACKGPRFGPGLIAIRPCEYIFGIRGLPFIFQCCSPECVYIFRRGIADPIELRAGEKEDIIHVPTAGEYERGDTIVDAENCQSGARSQSPFSPVLRRRTTNDSTDVYSNISHQPSERPIKSRTETEG